MRDVLAGLAEGIAGAVRQLTMTFLGAMTALIIWQVFARYVLNAPPKWTEELALYMMVWLGLLGACLGVREGIHIGMEMLIVRLPIRAQRAAEVLIDTAVGLFGLHLVWEGWDLVRLAWGQTSPATRLPVGWVYTVLPLSGVLIFLFSVERLARRTPAGEPVSR